MIDTHDLIEDQALSAENGQIACFDSFVLQSGARGIEYIENGEDVCVQHENTQICYTKKGVFVATINQDTGKMSKPVAVSPMTIIPVAIVLPYDDPKSSAWVILEGRDVASGGLIREMVKLAALGSPSAYRADLSRLQEAGFPIMERVAGGKSLATALHVTAVEWCREKKLPTIFAAIKNGWQRPGGKGKIDGVDVSRPVHITPGAPGYAGVDEPVHFKGGSFELQKAILQEMAINSPGFLLVLATFAGGYFRDWVPVETKIVHWFGNTSQGKTLAQLAAASMIGPITGTYCVNAWTSSEMGIQTILNMFNHGSLMMDEAHALIAKYQSKRDVVLQILMSFGNDQMATKSTQTGKARERKNWNVTLLSNGNVDLTHVGQGSAQYDALRARVLEIDINRWPVFGWSNFDKAMECKNVLSKNYGHIYPLIINSIVENNEKYLTTYNDFCAPIAKIVDEAGSAANYIGRRAQGWALTRVGLEILKDVLGFDIEAAGRMLNEITMDDLEIAEEQAQDEVCAVAAEVRAFVGSNMGNAKIKGHWYSAGAGPDPQSQEIQALRAKDMSQNVREVGIIVEQKGIMLEDELITGTVFVSSNAVFRNGGDIKALAQRAFDCGLLERQGRHMTHKHAALGRAYRFDLSKAAQAEQEAMIKEELAEEAALATRPAPPTDAPF